MSMREYEYAKEIIFKYPELSTFIGPREEALLIAAQEVLSVTFPPTYRRFILEYGAGGFGSFEICGVVEEDFEKSGFPDIVWLTTKWRKEGDFPIFLLPIYSLGDGEWFCIDLRMLEDAEAKIVAYTPGYSSADRTLDVIAKDFGELFLNLVKQELIIRKHLSNSQVG